MTVKSSLEEVKKLTCKSKLPFDEAGKDIVCNYGNVLISEENLEIPLTEELEKNIDNAVEDNKTIEAF